MASDKLFLKDMRENIDTANASMSSNAYEDQGKRGKMLFLSFLITVVLFFVKILQKSEMSLIEVYGLSAGLAVLSYLGLIWAFDFAVNRKDMLRIIPQSALFVFSEVLFLQMFFFASFDRVSEALVMIGLLILLFIGSYVSFLMANIFSVAQYKPIPLAQVAKTTSYIISIVTVFFVSFAVFASEFPLWLVVFLLVLSYFIVAYFHISNLALTNCACSRVVVLIVWIMLIATLSVSFLGSRHEILALVPTSVFFGVVGMIVANDRKETSVLMVLQYLLLIIIAISANFVVI